MRRVSDSWGLFLNKIFKILIFKVRDYYGRSLKISMVLLKGI